MIIRRNLKQIAKAKKKNWRTIKKSIGEYEEVWRVNKSGREELVGYMEKVPKTILVSEEEYLKDRSF